MRRLISIGILMLFSIIFSAVNAGHTAPVFVDDDVGVTMSIDNDVFIPVFVDVEASGQVADPMKILLSEGTVLYSLSRCETYMNQNYSDNRCGLYNPFWQELTLDNSVVNFWTNYDTHTVQSILVMVPSRLDIGELASKVLHS